MPKGCFCTELQQFSGLKYGQWVCQSLWWIAFTLMVSLWGWQRGADACWDVPDVSCCLCGRRTAWCVAAAWWTAGAEKGLCAGLQITLHIHVLLPPPLCTGSLVYPLWWRGKTTQNRGVQSTQQPSTEPYSSYSAAPEWLYFSNLQISPCEKPEINERANACFSLSCWTSEASHSHDHVCRCVCVCVCVGAWEYLSVDSDNKTTLYVFIIAVCLNTEYWVLNPVLLSKQHNNKCMKEVQLQVWCANTYLVLSSAV